ncbi:MAG: hypothetical protein K2N09_05610 [Muribaculaceae bacterium]|nr:hypothetical protein [Muribaculaceae bacterium]
MKKIFTLMAAAAIAISASAETAVLSNPGKVKANPLNAEQLGAPEGFVLTCLKEDKTLDPGNGLITVDGAEYQAIKISNGAQNQVTLPEGYVASKVTFYTTINKDAATDRVCYWAEVAGTTYTAEDNNGIIESFKDFENPNIQSFNIPDMKEFTFKNTGEQPLVVIEVTYHLEGESGVSTAIVADENAPIFNAQGVRVNADAKGLLIQNGKKFIRK